MTDVANEHSKGANLTEPIRPDDTEVQAQSRQLSIAIERYAKRIEEIKQLTAGQKERVAEELRLVNELQRTRGHLQAAQREKQAVRRELDRVNEKREALRVRARQIKANAGEASLEEIEKQIRKYEDKVNKTELTEEQEQECIAAIQTLVRSRENLRNQQELLDSVQDDHGGHGDPTDRMKRVDAEVDKWKAEEKRGLESLERFKGKKKEVLDVEELNAEKQECWEVLCALRAKKKEIDNAFRRRLNAYEREKVAYERAKRKQQNEQRKLERKAQEEQEGTRMVNEKPVVKEFRRPPRRHVNRVPPKPDTRAAERKKADQRRRLINQQKQRIQQKIAMCDELLRYLLPHKVSLGKAETAEQSDPEPQTIDAGTHEAAVASLGPGMKQLKKKEVDECDAWLQGTKSKKAKHKKPKRSAKPERPEEKILVYSLEICQTFSSLEVRAPTTLADVPKAIEILEKLKTDLQLTKTVPDDESKAPNSETAKSQDVPSHTPDVEKVEESKPQPDLEDTDMAFIPETHEVQSARTEETDLKEALSPAVAEGEATEAEEQVLPVVERYEPAVQEKETNAVVVGETVSEDLSDQELSKAPQEQETQDNAVIMEETVSEDLSVQELPRTPQEQETQDNAVIMEETVSEKPSLSELSMAQQEQEIPDNAVVREETVSEKPSLSELCKSQLPATLDDLDPIEFIAAAMTPKHHETLTSVLEEPESSIPVPQFEERICEFPIRLLFDVLSDTCIKVDLKFEADSSF